MHVNDYTQVVIISMVFSCRCENTNVFGDTLWTHFLQSMQIQAVYRHYPNHALQQTFINYSHSYALQLLCMVYTIVFCLYNNLKDSMQYIEIDMCMHECLYSQLHNTVLQIIKYSYKTIHHYMQIYSIAVQLTLYTYIHTCMHVCMQLCMYVQRTQMKNNQLIEPATCKLHMQLYTNNCPSSAG